MRRKILLLFITFVVVTSLVIAGCAAPAPAPAPAPSPAPTPAPAPEPEPIVITVMTALPMYFGSMEPAQWLIDRINERAKGELILEYKGGWEVIGVNEQPMAVKAGVIDMTSTWVQISEDLGADMMGLSRLTPQEERENGFYDYFNELNQQHGLFYLGRMWAWEGPGTVIFTNKRVETPSELAGQMLAAELLYAGFPEALGVVPMAIPDDELYTALERGVVDGFVNPIDQVLYAGYQEVVKYMIDHPYYKTNGMQIMNLDTWNSLPKHLQDLVMEVMIEVEADQGPFYTGIRETDRQGLIDAGVELITFSPADAEWYINLAYDSIWDLEMEKNPEHAAKMRELLTK